MERGGEREKALPLIERHWQKFNARTIEPRTPELYEAAFLDLLPQGANVLDVGCGNMDFTRQLANLRKDIKWDVYDKDASIKERYDVDALHGKVLGVGSFGQLHEMARSVKMIGLYDGVTSYRGLMFEENIDRVLKGISRMLKPGGYLYFDCLAPSDNLEMFKIKDGEGWKTIGVPYNETEVNWAVRLSGLKLVEFRQETPEYQLPTGTANVLTNIIIAKK